MSFPRSSLCPVLLVVFCAVTSGCGTFGSGGRNQTILVISEPPGAEVYHKDKLIAHTPDYVQIRAEKNPEIYFAAPGSQEKAKVKLETSYRWKRSFFSNLLFLTYAPIGWVTDFISGGAWEVKSPKNFKFEIGEKRQSEKKSTHKTIAIAPPSIKSRDFSDQIGMALEKTLRSQGKYTVLEYEKTSPLFYYHSGGSGVPEKDNDREDLYYELNNDLVLVSTANLVDDSFEVSSELRDAYTNELLSTTKQRFYSNDVGLTRHMEIHDGLGDYFYFLPNTVFINFANTSQHLVINHEEHQGKLAAGQGFFESASQIVERISLTRTEPIRSDTIGHWSLKFLPDFNVSTSRVEFSDYAPIKDVKFRRTLLSAGYGLRFAYVSSWGSPYFDFIPHAAWTRIKSSGAQQDATVSGVSILSTVELGYMYYLDRNFVLKLFTRSINEDTGVWSEAISKTSQSQQQVNSNSFSFVGLSIGYTFGVDAAQSYLSEKRPPQVIGKK